MHDRHLDYLFDEMDIPLVFAYSHGTEKDTYITYSNRDSAADIIRFLIGKGHKHIAVIAGHPHSYPTAQRLLGIQMAMQQAGLSLPQEYIRYGNWEYESGMVQTGELLRLPIRPTAIFAMNDLMPTTEIGVQAALHIIDMISNPRIHPAREIINCSIVERASV